MMANCIQMDMECAEICKATAALLSLESSRARELCRLCAEWCIDCANECSQHRYDHCQECAEACKKCATACSNMAEMESTTV